MLCVCCACATLVPRIYSTGATCAVVWRVRAWVTLEISFFFFFSEKFKVGIFESLAFDFLIVRFLHLQIFASLNFRTISRRREYESEDLNCMKIKLTLQGDTFHTI